MSYTKIFVEHYKKTSTKRWSTEYTLLKAYDVRVKSAIGSVRNTFSFKVTNQNDEYSDQFGMNDKILIYVVKDKDTYSTSDLVMTGSIKSFLKQVEGTAEFISVKGIDYSEVIMNAITFVSVDNENSMEVLQEAINVVNDRSHSHSTEESFYIKWNDDNPTTKSDGTAFPVHYNIREYDVSVLSLLEKYLAPEYLDDGNYYWYVNLNNELVIRKRLAETTEIAGEKVTFTEGNNIYSTKMVVVNDNVRNWVIWKAGFGPEGKSIQGFLQNSESINRNGIKPWILLLSTANDIIQKEKKENANMSAGSLYPTGYPYTSTFKSSGAYSIDEGGITISATVGNAVTVDSDAEWNYAFDREVRFQGNAKADRFLKLNAKGYIQVELDIPLTTSYQVGQVVEYTSPRYGFNSKQLRVNEVNYNIKGTTLVLKEDEATI